MLISFLFEGVLAQKLPEFCFSGSFSNSQNVLSRYLLEMP